jgi:hypothetical protein
MHYIFNQKEYIEEETIKNRLIEIHHNIIKWENFLKLKKVEIMSHLKKVEELKQKSKRKTQKPWHLWS